jgi:predicted ABC-type transport system involved in lysophospholipase L1 biosynthesis ATPase subunit
MNISTILKTENLSKQYRSGERDLTVLENVSFSVQEGTTCAIVGPSGSGKTTLLGLCAGLDRCTSGSVTLNGINLNDLSEDDRALVRNQYVGFVFQNFQLMPTLTALENVMVPMELRGEGNVRRYAAELLESVGLGDRLDHYPPNCWKVWAWATGWIITRCSFPAASSSGWRWRGRLSTALKFYLSMSPPAIWMRKPARKSNIFCSI